MTNPYRQVCTDADPRAHIVKVGMFFDGENKALCGRKPFPDKWYIPAGIAGAQKSTCPGCVTAYKQRRS
ncbi:hypothetical protein [Streptomyces sp. NPDC055085]